jgi:large subunit ribosomal protein L25
MMATSYYKLEIENRKSVGKKASKLIRRAGKIPSVLYYKGEKPVSISIDKQLLNQAIKSDQRIYEVEIDSESQYVMIKEAQYHPITDEIIHVDFMRVRRSEKMTISVPITLVGKPAGVTEGGILSQSMTQIEISCFPTNVPESIEVNVDHLDINSSVSVGDVTVDDEDIEIISASDLSIASVIPPAVEEEPVIAEEEALDEEAVDGESPDEEGEKADKDSGSSSDSENEDQAEDTN